MNEEDLIIKIENQIKQLETERKYLIANPNANKNVYQSLDRLDIVEQKLEELRDRLDNI